MSKRTINKEFEALFLADRLMSPNVSEWDIEKAADKLRDLHRCNEILRNGLAHMAQLYYALKEQKDDQDTHATR